MNRRAATYIAVGIAIGIAVALVVSLRAQVAPSYAIDQAAGTARVDLYVSGVVVTTYTYAAGAVTLSERTTSTSPTIAEFRNNVRILREWEGLIERYLTPPEGTPRSVGGEEFDKKSNGRLSIVYRHGSAKVSDAEWVPGTSVVTFKPRPQVTLPWVEFSALLDLWQRYIAAIGSEPP